MIQMPNKEQIREYLISNTIDQMVDFLMSSGKFALDQAMDKVYKSETVKRLQNTEGELYVQSPGYVCELLESETNI